MAAKFAEDEKRSLKQATTQVKSLAEQVNDELTCAICFSRYDKPKVLPCLHLYCENCLHTMVTKARDKTTLSCPQCQEIHQVPAEGVCGFKTYFTINNLLELLHIHEANDSGASKPGIVCESGLDEHPATARCLTCSGYLCSECVSLHKKMRLTSSHKTLTLAEIKLSDKSVGVRSIGKKKYCSDHEEEVLKMFCKTCKEAICRDCALVKHQSHDYVFVRDIRPEVQEQLESLVEKVRGKEGEFQEQVKLVEEVRGLNTNSLKSCEKSVNKACQSLIDAIETRRAVLIAELHGVHEKEEKVLLAELESISMALVRLTNGIRFTKQLLENGDDLEVVTMSVQASETLEGLNKMIVDKTKIGPTFLQADFKQNLKADIDQHGAIVYLAQPLADDIMVTRLPTETYPGEEVVFDIELSARVAKSALNFFKVKMTINNTDVKVKVKPLKVNMLRVSFVPHVAGSCVISIRFRDIEIMQCALEVTGLLEDVVEPELYNYLSQELPAPVQTNELGVYVLPTYGVTSTLVDVPPIATLEDASSTGSLVDLPQTRTQVDLTPITTYGVPLARNPTVAERTFKNVKKSKTSKTSRRMRQINGPWPGDI